MSDSLKKSHSLQKECQKLNRSNNKLFLQSIRVGKYEMTYNWREDSLFFDSSTMSMDINMGRLSAFGIYPRNMDITEEFIDNVFAYIRHYEDVFNMTGTIKAGIKIK